jgi:hypothetical protein
LKPTTKYLLSLIVLAAIGCSRATQDTTTTYNCRSVNQVDPFNIIVKDTILFNVTSRQAYDYARATSVNGWTTTCEK